MRKKLMIDDVKEPIPINAFDMVFYGSYSQFEQNFEFNCKQLDEKFCSNWL